MERREHLLIEIAQDITLYAWDKLYGKKGYEDSRRVLELFRQWAEEFDKCWKSNVEQTKQMLPKEPDYMLAVEKFAEWKVMECCVETFAPCDCIRTYIVEITRTSSSTKTFTVNAKNKEDAKDVALAMAHDTSFDEDTAEYSVGIVQLTQFMELV